MRRLYAFGFMLLLSSSQAWGNCITLDITPWTAPQRSLLSHVAALAAADTITEQVLTEATVEVCASTADISGLSSATLQSAAQTLVDTHIAAQVARQAALAEARTEVTTNTLCNASLDTVVTRITAEQTAIQADIDASTNLAQARTALTTINTRYSAALKFIARCIKSRSTLQGQGN